MCGDAYGPLINACREISTAIDLFAMTQLPRRRVLALLRRTDRMLESLETLNLLEVEHVPEAWRSQLAALVADLPFDYQPQIEPRPTPTAAIDVLFDIQEGLLRSKSGSELDDDELLEAAS
jgi:hypothetical protein